MKLTKTHKELFVRHVMNDVPQINYEEMATKIIHTFFETLLPDDLKGLKEKYGDIFCRAWVITPDGLSNVTCFVLNNDQEKLHKADCWRELVELGQKNIDQKEKYIGLRAHIQTLIAHYTTRKQVVDHFPEFEKYLPKDTGENQTTNLPAINTVAELKKAGWPKCSTA